MEIYLPSLSTANTTHVVALQANYVAQNAGDHTGAQDLPGAAATSEWDFLTGVDVRRDSDGAAIVVLGDSVTDGIGSARIRTGVGRTSWQSGYKSAAVWTT